MRRTFGCAILFLWSVMPVRAYCAAQDSTATDSSKARAITRKEFAVKLNISQLAYSDWAKGGENSLTYSVGLDGKLEKEYPKFTWMLTHKLVFGQTKIVNRSIRNAIDKIDVYGNIALKKKKFLDPYFSVSLITQFARGYNYKKDPPQLKSDFWDPAYLTESIGVGYAVNPNFKNKLGYGVKHTFTRQFHNYSDDPETKDVVEKNKIEHGLNFRSDLSAKPKENIKIETTMELFSNFGTFEEIDVRWDSKFTLRLAKCIVTELSIYLLYDRDMFTKLQLKEFLSIGIVYEFFKE